MYELFPYSMVKLLPEYDGKKFKFVHFNLSKDFVDMEKIIHNTKGRLDEVEGLKSGKYIKLVDKNSDEIVMSDTWMEKKTNKELVEKASGNILIGGLGIGMILLAIQKKRDVKSITVIEKYSEIINHVSSNLKFNKKVKIIHEDIFKYLPENKEKFDVIYFDIWNNICGDNYEEMKLLNKKFKKYLNKDGFIDSWRSDDCKKLTQ